MASGPSASELENIACEPCGAGLLSDVSGALRKEIIKIDTKPTKSKTRDAEQYRLEYDRNRFHQFRTLRDPACQAFFGAAPLAIDSEKQAQ